MTPPPPRLRIEAGIEGFRAQLPGLRLGNDSGWILVFVMLWWVVAFGILMALTAVWPELLDSELNLATGLAGGVGMLGWGPGWMAVDAWWANRNTRPIEADAVGLTVEGQHYRFSELEDLRITPGWMLIRPRNGTQHRVRLMTMPHEERWLAENLLPLYTHVRDRAGEVPGAMRRLVAEAE